MGAKWPELESSAPAQPQRAWGEAISFASHMLGTAYNMPFDAAMIERLCIVGTSSDCAEQIHRFMEAGAEAVCFNLLADPVDYDRRMEQLCAEVLPGLRAVGRPSSSGTCR